MSSTKAVPNAFEPARLGPLTLRNRILKAATFEGMTPDHVVTDRLIEFHRTMAAGGVGLTTLAYCAVSAEGCGTPNEIVLGPGVSSGLERLAAAVHDEGAAVSAQIGHAGAVAAATGHRGRSPSPMFSPLAMRRTIPLDAEEIRLVSRDFASATTVLRESGFDAVEVHLGHGYLLSEFLSPSLNKRRDGYGGSIANRARLPREVLLAVREAAGPSMAVLAKLNAADGVPGGLEVDESVEAARLLEADGALDALEITAGSSLQNPMYLFRGDAPVHELAANFKQPMRTAMRLFGGRFLREYPFEEAYLLPYARQFRSALRLPLVLLGGISAPETVEQAMREGFEFVALGRALLREPDLVHQWSAGSGRASLCIHCNKCMATIYTGTRCVLTTPRLDGASGLS
ncbi:MAG TPA: NADH:flavin oxidoreductase [Acidimicrobiales bacterium]|nr:NADH:flavin oxidoreductase [Acidimicrobiales bacterium]